MATSVSFSGLGSGIDFSKVTEAVIADRSRPITQLQQQSANLSSQTDAFKQLNGLLVTLTSAADALADRTLGSGRLVTSSSSAIVTASGTDAASLGTIGLSVSRLATRYVEATRSFNSAAAPVLANGAATATFQLQTGGNATGPIINIDSTNNSLTGLRDAINNAKAGVNATIVDVRGDGTQFQLAITSQTTGSSNRIQLIETTSTGTAANLNLASLNNLGTTPDYTLLDASLSVNGLSITRPTNSISDAVSGVTFNLQNVGNATLNITQNTDAVAGKLTAFVQAYNSVQDFIAAQYKPDGEGKPSGVLVGDSTLRTVQQQIRDAVGTIATANGGAFSNLTQIGIGRDTSGKLTIDNTVLGEKLKNSFGDVQALLSGKTVSNSGIGQLIHQATNNLSDAVTGQVQTAINGNQTSIKSINKSISDQLDRINLLRDSLTRQFAAIDAAINQINGQGSALTNILKSLEPSK